MRVGEEDDIGVEVADVGMGESDVKGVGAACRDKETLEKGELVDNGLDVVGDGIANGERQGWEAVANGGANQAVCAGANVSGVAGELANDGGVGRGYRVVGEGAGDEWDIKEYGWNVGAANCEFDVGDSREGGDEGGENVERLYGIRFDVDGESARVLVGGANMVDGGGVCSTRTSNFGREKVSDKDLDVIARKDGVGICGVLDGAVCVDVAEAHGNKGGKNENV
jgi:hypothetical protein